MGKAYHAYLEQTGLKEYRETEGFKDVLVLRREIGDETEYLLVTLWDNMDAVTAIRRAGTGARGLLSGRR